MERAAARGDSGAAAGRRTRRGGDAGAWVPDLSTEDGRPKYRGIGGAAEGEEVVRWQGAAFAERRSRVVACVVVVGRWTCSRAVSC